MGALLYAYRDHYEFYEQRYLLHTVQPGWTVLDVGANQGLFTLLMAHRVGPDGRVLAFEPSQEQHDRLLLNVQANGFMWVEPFRVALSSADGDATLFHDRVNDGGGALMPPGNASGIGESVPLTKLDTFFERWHVQPPVRLDMIKVDIEGAEMEFLKGAVGIIDRFRPLLLMEVGPEGLARFGATEEDVRHFLAAHDYRAVDCRTGRAIPYGVRITGITNVLFCPAADGRQPISEHMFAASR